MPQMMPINWILSLFFFISCFILFMIIKYFIFIHKINPNKINSIFFFKHKNWKW
uniref:ATP synthase complex subunit 8 n=1 Tax=Cethosia biblis TaxID=876379 RepID=A0A0A7AUM3_9NEOP|nr:ATP synthase F0 subunit 8 [Cethosia biblis]AHL17257.1 ATP synthase F0 subunit 8 [Cethosia biblis]